MENMLEIKNVTKKFSDKGFMLDNVSFDLPRGTVTGLIGENGAGKTTLIKLIMNIYGRDSGKITMAEDIDNVLNEEMFKENIGYVADEDYLFYNTSVAKIEKAFSTAFEKWDKKLFEKYMKMWQIDVKKNCSQLSKGMKTKVMLALALAHDPKVLILDEPTAGLDPAARIEMLDILREFVSDGEKAALFSTHITGDLDKIADYIAMMIDGKITEVLSADEAQEKYAVISGEKRHLIESLTIGSKLTNTGFEALVLRKHVERFGDVNVRTPNYEDILVHTIMQNRKNRENKG